MDIVSFLATVMPKNQAGYFNYCLRSRDSTWHEVWLDWPNDLAKIATSALEHRAEYDVFFSPALFHTRCSTKECVMPSSTLMCDIDAGDVYHAPLQPSILVQTSPDRRQGAWLLDEDAQDVDLLELLSRKITYSIEGADKSGWPLGHKMRLPNTYNHKYLTGPSLIEVVDSPLKRYSIDEIGLLSDIDSLTLQRFDPDFINSPPVKSPDGRGPHELLDSIRELVPPRVISDYVVTVQDRSAALWILMCSAFRAGLAREQVYWLAKHSANNKFSSLLYHADRELAKDVLRAEQEVLTRKSNVRDEVDDARKLKLPRTDKFRMIKNMVQNHMQKEGSFVKTDSNEEFYVPRDSGRPVYVSPGSTLFKSLLDIKYGLNPTDPEQEYVKQGIINYVVSLQPSVEIGTMSYYDAKSNTVLVHSGTRDVYVITPGNIDKVPDGSHGILFPWSHMYEPFNLVPGVESNYDWSEDAFGPLENVIDLTGPEARCLLRVFTLFIFMRSAAMSRPILAFFGQPGGGKSTTMKRLNLLIYGSRTGITTVTTPQDYDNLVTSCPFVAIDGVDTFNAWFSDKLSQSASVTDLGKRKLFSDNEAIRFARQAIVGVTAYNPKFMREDIADRLLLFNFKRLEEFRPETPIYNKLLKDRPRMLTALCNDLAKVLSTPPIPYTDLQFRIEDFARLGEWISIALTCEECPDYHELFRSTIKKMSGSAADFTLNEDASLVHALEAWIASTSTSHEDYLPLNQLWEALQLYCPNSEVATLKHKYRSPATLGRKLWTLQATLKTQFDVSWKSDHGARLWRITKK